jgi:hypothetical protein
MTKLYESYTFDLEPKTLDALQELIFTHAPRDASSTSAELLNLSNEIRARLQKIANPVAESLPEKPSVPKSDWLDA